MLVLDYDQLVTIARKYDQQSHSTLLSVEEPRRDGDRGTSDWERAKACEEAMGPNGDGFVVVRGIQNYTSLRNRLLPLAQKLALMPNSERATILKVINPSQTSSISILRKRALLPLRPVRVFRVLGFEIASAMPSKKTFTGNYFISSDVFMKTSFYSFLFSSVCVCRS